MSDIAFDELLSKLNYNNSVFYRTDISQFEPENAHLFRDAASTGVLGIYMVRTSPEIEGQPVQPAVFVAQAANEDEARKIHKNLWNLANAPIIIILTPNRVFVYTGFNYSENKNEDAGLIGKFKLDENDLRRLLAWLSAQAIDTGSIWRSEFTRELNPDTHIHARLLKSLRQLGVVLRDHDLDTPVAHNLIGKYVYIRYLYDRKILTSEWLGQYNLSINEILGRNANAKSLKKLVEILEERFNGKIFPIDFDSSAAPTNFHVALTAAIFNGDQIVQSNIDEKTVTTQLHLDFQAYDFHYIPVETLSAVYEQFIEQKDDTGVVYTSEVLANYLLSEIDTVKPLQLSTKILDPSCGSGVFLVLAYRRIIEQAIKQSNYKLSPNDLKNLLSGIYGIEKERDACFITEFSLILTLLHYIEPPDLHKLPTFHFPNLHNTQIFHADFFDFNGENCEVNFWELGHKFDWIVGNPPWITISKGSVNQRFVNVWMNNSQNKKTQPVGGRQVAEAFSWVVADLIEDEGVIGLLLPATSLFNNESRTYRQKFFSKFDVIRITNFTNLREILFKGRAEKPAITVVYRLPSLEHEKLDILHIAPLITNQLTTNNIEPWAILINETDIQNIKFTDIELDDSITWKIALRGNYRDKRVLKQISRLFPLTIGQLAKDKKWSVYQGLQLRNIQEKDSKVALPELIGVEEFQPEEMKHALHYFSVPTNVLHPITKERANVRKRSGKAGLRVIPAPHITIAAAGLRYAIYSDKDFVIPHPQIGISGQKEDAEHLKALSVYLRSSFVSYYLFFQAPQWGVAWRTKTLSANQLKQLRVPALSAQQIRELAHLRDQLVILENQRVHTLEENWSQTSMFAPITNAPKKYSKSNVSSKERFNFRFQLQIELRKRIDTAINQLLNIPIELSTIIEEFVRVRLTVDAIAQINNITRQPNHQELKAYAIQLRDHLDSFVTDGSHFRLIIIPSSQFIKCQIQITNEQSAISVEIKPVSSDSNEEINALATELRHETSQWSYVQRGLHLYDGSFIHIYKEAQLVNWTQTQAMNDGADIISQVLTRTSE